MTVPTPSKHTPGIPLVLLIFSQDLYVTQQQQEERFHPQQHAQQIQFNLNSKCWLVDNISNTSSATEALLAGGEGREGPSDYCTEVCKVRNWLFFQFEYNFYSLPTFALEHLCSHKLRLGGRISPIRALLRELLFESIQLLQAQDFCLLLPPPVLRTSHRRPSPKALTRGLG